MKSCPVCSHENKENASVCSNCQFEFDRSFLKQKTVLFEKEQESFEPDSFISDRYRIVKELGRGGMGVVYLVKDSKLRDRPVALKMIHPELMALEEARQPFKDEVILCLDLLHENIVRIYNLEEWGGYSFFTMEYIQGPNLRQLLDERKARKQALTLEETIQVASQILDALAYAHKTTIHRDIKPENILIQGTFPDIQVKVLDFGIARILSDPQYNQHTRHTQTHPLQSMGTAYYISPEQMQGSRQVDQRSDLYAVGMMIYEMLTGEIAVGRFKLPGEILEDLPPDIDSIIDKLLSSNPKERHETADQLKAELVDCLSFKSEERQKLVKEIEACIEKAEFDKAAALNDQAGTIRKISRRIEDVRNRYKEQMDNGDRHVSSNEYARAKTCYRSALELCPESIEARERQKYVDEKQKQEQEKKDAFDALLKQIVQKIEKNRFDTALNLLAQAEKAGMDQARVEDLRRVLARQGCKFEVAEARKKLAENDLAGAEKHAVKAAHWCSSDESEILIKEIKARHQKNAAEKERLRQEEAEKKKKELEHLREEEKKKALAQHLATARLCIARASFEEARQALEKAIGISANDTAVKEVQKSLLETEQKYSHHVEQARQSLQSGRFEEAVDHAEHAGKVCPQSPEPATLIKTVNRKKAGVKIIHNLREKKKWVAGVLIFLVAAVAVMASVLNQQNQEQPAGKKAPGPEKQYAYLHIDTEPADAQIRIMNIEPKFQQGIRLDPFKKYDIEVSAPGHLLRKKTVTTKPGKNNLRIILSPQVADPGEETPGNLPPEESPPPGEEPPEEPPAETRVASLYIDTEPADARIRIMNIKPKFEQGIRLTPNEKYDIEVSAPGYALHEETVTLKPGENNMSITLALEEKDDPGSDLEYGSIQVISSPEDAMVYINGIRQGTTPFMKKKINTGKWTIRVEKDCYQGFGQTIDIGPGTERTLYFDLQADCGSLNITGSPRGAAIALDGKATGTLPRKLADIPSGTYQLTISRSGYKSHNRSVLIEPGKTRDVYISLDEMISRLYVDTTPSHADVRILNDRRSYTRGMTLDPGRYQVEVSLAGHVTRKQWVTLAEDHDTHVRISLEKETPRKETPKGFTNSLGMKFVWVEPGKFAMGSPASEQGRYENETRHQVTLTRGYFIQTTEVTQEQWKAIMDDVNPSRFLRCGGNCPVEQVSWNDVQKFIQRLNRKEGKKITYRLPTEAEWEYAARGRDEPFVFSGSSSIQSVGWFKGNSKRKTHPVGMKKPNALGLYDMTGNVWEWVQDSYEDYPSGHVTDPVEDISGSFRIRRGGSWNSGERDCRVAYRYGSSPDRRAVNFGFRLVGQ